MHKIMEWLNANSNALMVIITFVYVIATVAIWWANHKSAKASTKQLETSIEQYEEMKRLNFMPYFQLLGADTPGNSCILLPLKAKTGNGKSQDTQVDFFIQNFGAGTAIEMKYTWNSLDCSTDRGRFIASALRSGDKRIVRIKFIYSEEYTPEGNASIDLKYRDLLGNNYIQKIEFEFKNGLCKKYGIDSPVLIDKEQNNV